MTTRTILQVETATPDRVGPFIIKNVLPTRNLRHLDPFLLVHHLPPSPLGKETEGRIPPHPHAGFEVMTYLLEGEFFHRDSQGHDQVARAGDINWMSSASGIIHSEGPTEQYRSTGGKVSLLQIWINVPAAHKNEKPAFLHYPAATLPAMAKEGSSIRVLLGNWGGVQSPVSVKTPVFLYHIKTEKGKLLSVPVAEKFQASLYMLAGKVRALNETLEKGQLGVFAQDGDQVVWEALQDAELIFFGGEPIGERIQHYGPFVMNNLEEIQQKILQYESGQMGELEN